MFLEIITPEAVLFSSSNVDLVTVPGVNGEFQILNNHAPIVSILEKGLIKVIGSDIMINDVYHNKFDLKDNKYLLLIDDGIVETNTNSIVILATLPTSIQ